MIVFYDGVEEKQNRAIFRAEQKQIIISFIRLLLLLICKAVTIAGDRCTLNGNDKNISFIF